MFDSLCSNFNTYWENLVNMENSTNALDKNVALNFLQYIKTPAKFEEKGFPHN